MPVRVAQSGRPQLLLRGGRRQLGDELRSPRRAGPGCRRAARTGRPGSRATTPCRPGRPTSPAAPVALPALLAMTSCSLAGNANWLGRMLLQGEECGVGVGQGRVRERNHRVDVLPARRGRSRIGRRLVRTARAGRGQQRLRGQQGQQTVGRRSSGRRSRRSARQIAAAQPGFAVAASAACVRPRVVASTSGELAIDGVGPQALRGGVLAVDVGAQPLHPQRRVRDPDVGQGGVGLGQRRLFGGRARRVDRDRRAGAVDDRVAARPSSRRCRTEPARSPRRRRRSARPPRCTPSCGRLGRLRSRRGGAAGRCGGLAEE